MDGGGIVVPPGGGGTVTGPAIAAAGGLLANGTVPMTGNLDMGGQSIIDLNSITAGGIVLDSTVTPNTPAAGDVALGAINVGAIMPATTDPSGAVSPLQHAIWGCNQSIYYPGSAGNFTALGVLATFDTSVVTTPVPASTDVSTQTHRQVWTAVVATGRTAGIGGGSSSVNEYWRGNAAGRGGFFCCFVFSASAGWTAGNTMWIGLTSQPSSMVGTGGVQQNPSARNAHCVGLGADAGDTSLTLMTGAGAAATKTTVTGIPTLASTPQLLRLFLYAPPNGSSIFYRVDDLVAGTIVVNTSTSTTLPTNTQFMAPAVTMGTAANTAAAIAIAKIYVHSITPNY